MEIKVLPKTIVEGVKGRIHVVQVDGVNILHLERKKDNSAFSLFFDQYISGGKITMRYIVPLKADTVEEALEMFHIAETERSYIVQFQHETGWKVKTFFKMRPDK